ncbi:MAG: CPBP family intramembrane metalloprotease domain-containing protein [Anaerolineae bacterium]|nr:MAG: CPBP family intramembrane metalloprotease domain-containing protein [Anaerolineae bacterium]
MIDKKSLSWFLFIAFAISWVLFAAPLAAKNNPEIYVRLLFALFALAMWGPGIAAIIVTLFIARQPFSSLRLNTLGPKRYYFWAWFLAPLIAVLTLGATILLGTGTFDPTLSAIRQMMAQTPPTQTLPSTETLLLLQSIFTLTLAPFINLVFALGEELGWRGFLLPKLLPLGEWKALLLSGAIWGFWHAPAIALHGHNFPQHPYLGVLVMMIGCILLGIIFGWLYLKTRSPWAPALAHGAFNAIAPAAILFLHPEELDTALGGNPLGLAGWVAMTVIILALFALRQLGWQTSQQSVSAAGHTIH